MFDSHLAYGPNRLTLEQCLEPDRPQIVRDLARRVESLQSALAAAKSPAAARPSQRPPAPPPAGAQPPQTPAAAAPPAPSGSPALVPRALKRTASIRPPAQGVRPPSTEVSVPPPAGTPPTPPST